MGFIANPYPIMKASDIYITASQSEGISNALLESIALGCVPISTYSGGAEEIIQNNDNGFLVEYNYEEKLALLIENLYNHQELREKLTNKAKNMVETTFSSERMAIEITTFCQSIISKKHQ
jgi:glycosyltransferase involved in cell wall biosynthesis